MSAGEQVPHAEQTATEPDDGLTSEDRAAFAEMQSQPEVAPPAPEGEVEAKPEGEEAPAGDGVVAESEEDGDDTGEAEGAAQAEGGKKPRRVSFAKYDRDLKARDATIAELQAGAKANAEMQARLDERMKIINEALTPKQQKEQAEDDPEPDVEQDIFAHNAWLRRQLAKTNDTVKQLHTEMQGQAAQTTAERAYVSDVQRFSHQEPKFLEAYNFLMASRISELAIYRFGKDLSDPNVKLTPEEIQTVGQIVEDEETQLVQSAISSKRSPAQQLFNLAKTRGWKPAPPAANGDAANGAAKPNGKAAPGNLAETAAALEAAGGAAKPNGSGVKEEIQRMQRGVEASVSLSGAGGAPATVITPAMIANMPQDEFNELADRLSESEMRRLMGG